MEAAEANRGGGGQAGGGAEAVAAVPQNGIFEEMMAAQEAKGFNVKSEKQIFKRYLRINERMVEYPDGREVSYDVLVSASNKFVTVLPYDSKTKQFRLIREYWQGPHSIGVGVACGSFEEKKHASVREAAECELSEECCLKGGKWVRLIPESHPGVVEAKWAAVRFTPFLVIDAEEDSTPQKMDEEEYILQHPVGVEELEDLMCSGLMQLPSVQTVVMALRHLRREGYIDP